MIINFHKLFKFSLASILPSLLAIIELNSSLCVLARLNPSMTKSLIKGFRDLLYKLSNRLTSGLSEFQLI